MKSTFQQQPNFLSRSKIPNRTQKIKKIFDLEEDKNQSPVKPKDLLTIKYNQTIYFQNNNQKNEDINNYLSKAITKNNNNNDKILLNFNINNNYYTSFKSFNNNNNNNNYINSFNKTHSAISLSKEYQKPLNKNPFSINNSNNILIRTSSINNNNNNNNKNFSSSNISLKRVNSKESTNSNGLLYINCMNCGNSIPADNIEEHSKTCVKVSEEILKNDNNKNEIFSINFKLKKLKEHLTSINTGEIKIPTNIEKEISFISTVLLEYVNECINLENINLNNIKNFKKILKNLEMLSLTYKTSMSSMILIDRSKILVNEKLKVFKNEYRNIVNNRKINNSISKNEINNKIEIEMKNKMKLLEKITQQTEFEKTKVKNLRKSATPKDRPSLNQINFNFNNKRNEINNNNKNEINNNKNEINNNKIEINNKNEINNNKNEINNNKNEINNIKNEINNNNNNEKENEKYKYKNNNVNMSSDEKDDSILNDNNVSNIKYINTENKLDEILSDVDAKSNNNMSINTSMSNMSNLSEMNEILTGGFYNNNNNKDINFNFGTFASDENNNNNENNEDVNYNVKNNNLKKLFFREVFKIKFEKIHNTHVGQKIDSKYIWEECCKQKIPRNKWQQFIFQELSNPRKYLELKKNSLMKKNNPNMFIIDEEK